MHRHFEIAFFLFIGSNIRTAATAKIIAAIIAKIGAVVKIFVNIPMLYKTPAITPIKILKTAIKKIFRLELFIKSPCCFINFEIIHPVLLYL